MITIAIITRETTRASLAEADILDAPKAPSK